MSTIFCFDIRIYVYSDKRKEWVGVGWEGGLYYVICEHSLISQNSVINIDKNMMMEIRHDSELRTK